MCVCVCVCVCVWWSIELILWSFLFFTIGAGFGVAGVYVFLVRICGTAVRWSADVAVRRSAKATERLCYCDCENLTMKEWGSQESVVQRDEMACFSTVVV